MKKAKKGRKARTSRQVVAAKVVGGPLAPEISGWVLFTSAAGGTWVDARITGLPSYEPATEERPPVGPFGFHVHESGNCSVGTAEDPFQEAGGHWNPDDQPHGNHAGDLPVLFSNAGVAEMQVYTNRFRPEDVVGRSVVIHMHPDDYRSQPAGDSGPRLACGVIQVYRRNGGLMPMTLNRRG
ncbi:MAG: superoxide dismutase family protein [Bacillota bacterium]|jgi:Cu-Zn family superoxide dismutase